jgi:hypothetical protein
MLIRLSFFRLSRAPIPRVFADSISVNQWVFKSANTRGIGAKLEIQKKNLIREFFL